MKGKGLPLCQLRSSTFYFIDLFPPKGSMEEFVENHGRQDETGPQTTVAGLSWPSGPSPSFNIGIVAATPSALQTFRGRYEKPALRPGHLTRQGPAKPQLDPHLCFKNSCA
jgi:hypothetical protein